MLEVLVREWRRMVAILKDSLKETIDSYVFVAVLGFSALAILIMATVSFEPNPVNEGLEKITAKFADGSEEVELPFLGKVKVSPPLTEFKLPNLGELEGSKRPWTKEYDLVVEAQDKEQYGTRVAAMMEIFKEEDRKQKANPNRNTRLRRLQQDVNEEAAKIKERGERKGKTREQIYAEIQLYVGMRLIQELGALDDSELEHFIKKQFEQQGNWEVGTVTLTKKHKSTVKREVQERIDEDTVKKVKKDVEVETYEFHVKLKGNSNTYRVWPHTVKALFGAVPLTDSSEPGAFVFKIIVYGVGWVGAPLTMLLACVITAFYIPNMLRKGTIDLLLAKPITRFSLLWYKYLGGLTFMFLTTTFLVSGLWIALGLRSGIWEPAFLMLIPILTFQFAMYYALSTLLAVLTRSPIVCILACVMMYGLLFGVGWAYEITSAITRANAAMSRKKESPHWFISTVNVMHAGLPHNTDLFWLGEKHLYVSLVAPTEDTKTDLDEKYAHYNWGESIAVTVIWIVVLLGLAYWRFAVKDY